jgi:uncharacterized protein (DUF1810 family)
VELRISISSFASLVPEAAVDDPYNLERFVKAQNPVFEQVCAELRSGGKESHWMWFMFPQIKGLGYSSTSMRFAISSKEEAEAYLRHPILGPRLRECTELVVLVDGLSIRDIFGYPDYLKFHSCMTLFAQATSENQVFKDALKKYFGGELDRPTLERL